MHLFRQWSWLVMLGCTVACGPVAALDLGTIGPLHEIREPNALQFIQNRLKQMEKDGELARLEKQAKEHVAEQVSHPTPVPGLSRTETARTFYEDPTYTVPQDIVTPDGKVMYPAGYKFNPLSVISLSEHLLFFDGRDAAQVKYARELIAHYEGRVKPILVGGSPMDLMRDWKVQVFYDQAGWLTSRFGITQVPALVSQEGLKLRVDELKVKG